MALAAYHHGSTRVHRAIEAGASRNALDLIAAGHLDEYSATAMVGMLLLEAPELLQG